MNALDPRLNAYRPGLAHEALRGRLTAERFVEGEAARIGVAVASVRRAPAADAPLDTQLLFGEDVVVLDSDGGWSWVQAVRDRYVGYVEDGALGGGAAAATHRIAALATFVYPAPDMKLPPSTRLTLGARVAVEGEAAGFAAMVGGGFIWGSHLAALDRHEADFVAIAARLAGVPYLWGGRTTDGIDCSGLVQLALESAGISAPRDSDMQAAGLGSVVEGWKTKGLRRGDLVFWKGHVGIMTGPDALLHANAHHMAVAEEPFAEAVRRIAGAGLEVGGVRRPTAGS